MAGIHASWPVASGKRCAENLGEGGREGWAPPTVPTSACTESAEYPVGNHSRSPGSMSATAESERGNDAVGGSVASIRLGDAVAAAMVGSVLRMVATLLATPFGVWSKTTLLATLFVRVKIGVALCAPEKEGEGCCCVAMPSASLSVMM